MTYGLRKRWGRSSHTAQQHQNASKRAQSVGRG